MPANGYNYSSPRPSRYYNTKPRHVARWSNIPFLGRSVLLSRIQQQVLDTYGGKFPPLIKFITSPKWLFLYLRDFIHRNAPYQTYPSGKYGIFDMPTSDEGPLRLAVAADWATGTVESQKIADNIRSAKSHYTIHLGDVYFMGEKSQVEENCLGESEHGFRGVVWPTTSTRGSFALMGNHEMYSGGHGYFTKFLPHLGIYDRTGAVVQPQSASFFCLQSEHWLILGLDTGYHSGGIPFLSSVPVIRSIPFLNVDARFDRKMLRWLKHTINTLGPERIHGKGILLLTHHQPVSAFETAYPKQVRQLKKLGFLDGREFVWLYGHEHRFTIYNLQDLGKSLRAYPRCIGHGGMPVELSTLAKPDNRVAYYDPRRHPIDDQDQETKVGYNGHVQLQIDGPTLKIEYRDIDNSILLKESFVANGSNALQYSVTKPTGSPLRTGQQVMPIGLTFTERMVGPFSIKNISPANVSTDDLGVFQNASAQGEQDKTTCEFTLTITSNDLTQMLADPTHPAKITGTVTAPSLSDRPMTVVQGVFNLFAVDPNDVETRLMRYRMRLAAHDGKQFFFEGFKVVRDDGAFRVWHDTSTLYTTIANDPEMRNAVGRGVLRILPTDFAHQLTTIRATNAPNEAERLEAEARFGRFFAGVLFETYGGIFARPTAFDPDARPRKKRPLRVGKPESHTFQTSDSFRLRLSRYCGGPKGPVILIHGLGVASSIFSIDTIETNLLEYLFAAQYDVWLLDFRASIDLPYAAVQFTADDVATKDYPAAIAKVREVTGAATVQILAHCYGAMTFSMGLCSGEVQDVRSAVISQIGTHIVPPLPNRIRTGLHLPDVLDKLGVRSLDAYTDTHADWHEILYNKALGLYPVGQPCRNPVCHRITFMYAPLYQHSQLNEATHEALHELFGVANIRAFEGLGMMTRARHVLSADGSDVYLPRINRMSMPILFIHGAQNECFLPESTEQTFRAVSRANPGVPYSREVIPGYGHIDGIFGKDAVRDVYPFILRHFEETALRGY
jgi:choline dehydrogenase-like flavoprotein